MNVVGREGAPPVVFVSQLGEPGSDWKPVLEQLPAGAWIVTYDRPGTGDRPSRPAPNPPLPYSVFADELAQELDERGITEPAVVVGHSFGSLIARSFASRYPGRVAGAVHVDGSIPRMCFGPGFDNTGFGRVDGDHPKATAIDTVNGEIEIVGALQPPVPTMVITRTPGIWPPGFTEAADRLWTAYQRQLARECRAPLVVAENAGHQIPAEAPRLVAYVVDEVVRAARTGASCRLDPGELTKVGGRPGEA